MEYCLSFLVGCYLFLVLEIYRNSYSIHAGTLNVFVQNLRESIE
jgi:hypothetical protein